MIKKLLSIGMLLTIMINPLTPMSDQSIAFTDIDNDSKLQYFVYTGQELGLLYGTGNQQYAPTQNAKLCEILTMIGRVHEKVSQTPIGSGSAPAVSGVSPNRYYSKYAAWAIQNGLVREGEFVPERSVTIQEMADTLYRYLNTFAKDRLEEPANADKNGDGSAGSVDVKKYLFPTGSEKISPGKVVTREDAAAVVIRLYEVLTYPMDQDTPMSILVYTGAYGNTSRPVPFHQPIIISDYRQYLEIEEALRDIQDSRGQGYYTENHPQLVVDESFFETANIGAFNTLFAPSYPVWHFSLTLDGDSGIIRGVNMPIRDDSMESSDLHMITAMVAIPKNVTDVSYFDWYWTGFWSPDVNDA